MSLETTCLNRRNSATSRPASRYTALSGGGGSYLSRVKFGQNKAVSGRFCVVFSVLYAASGGRWRGVWCIRCCHFSSTAARSWWPLRWQWFAAHSTSNCVMAASRFRHGGLVPFVTVKISEPVNVMSASRRQSSPPRLSRLALARSQRQGSHSIPAASP